MDPITQEIFDLIRVKMLEQAAFDRDAYKQLVEETIEYYRERGLLTDDDNDEFIEDQLLDRWEWLQDHIKDEE
ncbi:MAG: hypothetical protein NTY12_00360 [Candidatus Falkowbacteria bacterium]|nr:hypothetical protein [Candidatus Falkowbacteria bacterium]